jgi:hypothetical protein
MGLLSVTLLIACLCGLSWLWDAQLRLRKRVAKLEEATGTGKPDPVADATPDD